MASDLLLEQAYLEVAKNIVANTNIFINELYPEVAKQMDTTKVRNNYKNLIGDFIEVRSQGLYDTLPCSRLYFGDEDIDAMFKAINVSKSFATECINKTYYGDEPNFSPKAAKDEFTMTQLCVIRYFSVKNMSKEAELAVLHLAFSGKFYPSLHYRSFPIVPARHVMEYTVNNVLTTKYDLISEGSVIATIRKIAMTWYNTYKNNKLKSFKDGEAVYCIQQLYSRIGSFMKNVATAYYKTYNKKDDLYIAYSSDSYDDEDYHLADNDLLKANKITETTMNYINQMGVDYQICKMASDENISVSEIKSIVESITSEPENSQDMKELISLIIVTYFQNSKEKDVRNVEFLTYTIAPKPNAKQKEILRQKELIEKFLRENSTAYVRRRSRVATRNSYERAIRTYFALTIHNANR